MSRHLLARLRAAEKRAEALIPELPDGVEPWRPGFIWPDGRGPHPPPPA